MGCCGTKPLTSVRSTPSTINNNLPIWYTHIQTISQSDIKLITLSLDGLIGISAKLQSQSLLTPVNTPFNTPQSITSQLSIRTAISPPQPSRQIVNNRALLSPPPMRHSRLLNVRDSVVDLVSVKTSYVRRGSPSADNRTQFFENFFEYLFKLDPLLELMFVNIRDKTTMMSRVISFILSEDVRLYDSQYLKQMTITHANLNIRLNHYVVVCQAFVLTIYKMRRLEFTDSMQNAWYQWFSVFITHIRPFVVN